MIDSESTTRRGVLLGAGALGAGAMLAACSGSKTAEAPPAETPAETTGSAPAGATAKAADVPVGGGLILESDKLVVTQPQAGQFHAFTAVCPHKHCAVNAIADGTIDCPCHGSRFSITDGSVVAGPATQPLAAKTVTVTGDVVTVS